MSLASCPQCGYIIADPTQPCPSCGNKVSTGSLKPAHGHSTRYRYKVLTQKDKWFSSKFDPVALENALNAYAEQGWRVIACSTAEIPGVLGSITNNREEMIIILEREI